MAELNLSPQMAEATVYEGEGGGYYAWTPAKSPVLSTAELGAGKLVLKPRGFALPHYADAYKIGYVVEGTCTVGLIFPNSPQEKVIIIKGPYAIPVPMGSISWWFNGGDSDLTIIFLGESSQSYNPGQFDYFFLTGALGVLGGFSTEFISKIYNFNEPDSKKLAKSQSESLIIKLGPEINMPGQPNCNIAHYVFDFVIGAEMTADTFPLINEFGLSANYVSVRPNSALDPSYSMDSYRIFYLIKGSGRAQIVGLNGTRVLDASVQEDQLFLVPKFFAVSLLADEKWMEFFCVYTSSRPIIGKLVGNRSVWKALSAPVLQASLNVSPEFVEIFKSKNEGDNKSFI